jgi:hypothetical protein
MNAIVLKNISSDGEPLEATFWPEKGMNMVSYKKGAMEVIDQSTKAPLFDVRYAGLGALIGPHFHHRHTAALPLIKDESLFPHIARVKAMGVQDPFSHGIARYAPWKAEATQTKVNAVLTGKDTWNEVPLAELEGQNFKMTYQAELLPDGLHVQLTVVSDYDSLVGIHYYYSLPQKTGEVTSLVKNEYLDKGALKSIPKEWLADGQHEFAFDLRHAADFTFYSHPDPLNGCIVLNAGTYKLTTYYSCQSQENCWQLYHPEGASYVCIEPVSSQDPRHPNLSVSSINLRLEINI